MINHTDKLNLILTSLPMTEILCLSTLDKLDFDGLVQDCSKWNALAIELLQSCAKPLV